MVTDGLTLSSPIESVRRFWIDHCKACRRIANEIGAQLGDHVLNNVWIPDGMKDVPADRHGTAYAPEGVARRNLRRKAAERD